MVYSYDISKAFLFTSSQNICLHTKRWNFGVVCFVNTLPNSNFIFLFLFSSALECFACDNGAFGEQCINEPASIENGFIKCQDDKTHCFTSRLEDKPDGSMATSNKSRCSIYRISEQAKKPRVILWQTFVNPSWLYSV